MEEKLLVELSIFVVVNNTGSKIKRTVNEAIQEVNSKYLTKQNIQFNSIIWEDYINNNAGNEIQNDLSTYIPDESVFLGIFSSELMTQTNTNKLKGIDEYNKVELLRKNGRTVWSLLFFEKGILKKYSKDPIYQDIIQLHNKAKKDSLMYKYDNLKTLKGFLIKNLMTIEYKY